MNVEIHKAVASEGREERRHMCPRQLPTTSMELRKNMAQEEVANTKSRLWPSVFSVRLFQTQCQLAAGDVSTKEMHKLIFDIQNKLQFD